MSISMRISIPVTAWPAYPLHLALTYKSRAGDYPFPSPFFLQPLSILSLPLASVAVVASFPVYIN